MRHLRRGFTLIEMLVAMALTMFIMVIVSQAFVTGLGVFHGLKGIGDMQAKLRVSMSLMRADLSADHFEGRRKLSDPSLTTTPPREGFFMIRNGNIGNVLANPFPAGAPWSSVWEGNDADGLPSYRAVDHVIAGTIKLRGNKRENYMMSQDLPTFPPPTPPNPQIWSPLSKNEVYFFGQDRDGLFNPGGPPESPSRYFPGKDIYSSQWAEFAYFLIRTGTSEEPENPAATSGTPLYGLYRSLYLLVPNPEKANILDKDKVGADVDTIGTTQDARLMTNFEYAGISCYPRLQPPPNNQLVFNSPADLADTTATSSAPPPPSQQTNRTAGMDRRVIKFGNTALGLPIQAGAFPPGSAANQPRSATLVVSNVVSFNVQALYPGESDFREATQVRYQAAVGSPTFYLRIFDTTMSNQYLLGLKIMIRVHDSATKQSRQMTLIQDM